MDHSLIKNISESNHVPAKTQLNLEDHRTCSFYITQVETHLKDLFSSEISSKFKVKKLNSEEIEDLHARITCIYKKTENESIKFQERFGTSSDFSQKPNKKSKELRNIKKLMTQTYLKIKDKNTSSLESEYKSLKKEYRRVQRRELYLKELSKLNHLETMAKKKDKREFWKFTRKLKEKSPRQKNFHTSSQTS